MAFRMQPDQPLAAEARRIADKQLQLAIIGLGAAHGADGDRRLHTARRHVKKVRAMIRLLEPRLGSGGRQRHHRLARVARMLGAIADSQALIRTLDALQRRYPGALAPDADALLTTGLQARERDVRRRAEFAGTLNRAAALLADEAEHVRTWQLASVDVKAVTSGVRRTARRARRAADRALAAPTTRRFNVWRRRVKDLWFQMRLLEGRTGGQLSEYQRRLEQLDGALGETRNCALLAEAIVTAALLPRHDAARCLRLIRRYRSELRGRARALAPEVHGAGARELAQRIARAWLGTLPAIHTPRTRRWRHIA